MNSYLEETGKKLDKEDVLEYVRGVSKKVVDIIGGTEVGPAAGFRDIVRSIIQDRGEIYSIADSMLLPGLPEPVNVNIPTRVGQRIGPNIWDELTEEEHGDIIDAAKAIHANYMVALKAIGKA